ncbi:hypothetical protein CQW23_07189 [Capsicum baccatum]|uniref:Uncharacterized protein n=1 Tax=Capsicum baccatum TaxID=33114 RepID=A0A2G2X5H9_CAPBA|nr:hypothetical protein CQW23_07189 [Capsicum baccatum]
MDLDPKNRSSPTTKTSIAVPPVLESKELPSHLRYAFLGSGNTLQVIVAADLSELHVETLISVLKKYKRAVDWTINDIIGIPPGICGKLGMKEQRLLVRHCLCKSRQRTRQGLCKCRQRTRQGLCYGLSSLNLNAIA